MAADAASRDCQHWMIRVVDGPALRCEEWCGREVPISREQLADLKRRAAAHDGSTATDDARRLLNEGR